MISTRELLLPEAQRKRRRECKSTTRGNISHQFTLMRRKATMLDLIRCSIKYTIKRYSKDNLHQDTQCPCMISKEINNKYKLLTKVQEECRLKDRINTMRSKSFKSHHLFISKRMMRRLRSSRSKTNGPKSKPRLRRSTKESSKPSTMRQFKSSKSMRKSTKSFWKDLTLFTAQAEREQSQMPPRVEY